MKADKASFLRTLDQPNPGTRFYLFHGVDDSGSRALADRLAQGLAADKFLIASGAIKADLALLAAEAGAMGLFGDRRLLWIDPAGDEIVPAVEALLSAPAIESAVVAIAGSLRKTSALLKLAESHASALSHQSDPIEGRDAERMVMDLGRAEGLAMSTDIAARIAGAADNNRFVVASELLKFALYLDATPDSPRQLEHETLDRLGADSGDGDLMRLGDLALDGQIDALVALLRRLSPGSAEIVAIIRSLQRRVLQLVPLRCRIDHGERADVVMTSLGKSLFWKDKPLIQRLLSRWSAARLAQVGERIAMLERRLILTSIPSVSALGEEVLAIARAARR